MTASACLARVHDRLDAEGVYTLPSWTTSAESWESWACVTC